MSNRMFRGKRTEYGEWVYGYLIGDDVIVGNIVEFTDEYFNTSFWWRVKPETVSQYAELKDAQNEREIYGYDIITFTIFDPVSGGDTQYTGVVMFSDGQWQIWNSATDPYWGSDGPFNLHAVWYNDDTIEVIGNTFDNAYLLNAANAAIESTEPHSEAEAEGGLTP